MPTLLTLDARELLDGAPNLGSPPAVYQRLVEVLNHPNSGVHEVAAVVSQDTALTARLLRLANSSYFSFSRPVDSVRQAVRLMGTTPVRDLALATSVTSVFRDLPPDLINLEDFWRHSLAVGMGARMMATDRRETNVDRFFVAGMLHDLGRLVLYMRAPDVARAVLEYAKDRDCHLYDAERELTGIDHGTIGGALMDRWSMPESLVECVWLHHAPDSSVQHPVETATIHLADVLANALSLGCSGERLVPPRHPDVWDALDLDPSSLPHMMDSLREEYSQVVSAFGL